MTPDRRRIFADKPRDPRPVINPGPPRYGCILFAVAALLGTAAIVMIDWSEMLSVIPERTATQADPTDTEPSVRSTDDAADPGPNPLPPHHVLPTASAGSAAATKPVPAGNPQSWTTDSDYPADALRASMKGVTGFTLQVGADGRVTGCTVTASSGWELLDSTSCRLLSRRARFRPARDAEGAAVASTYESRIRWTIPNF